MIAQKQVAVGVYWDHHAWQQARSAYLVDLDLDPASPDVFGQWLTRVVIWYAAMTPIGRTRKLSTLGTPPEDGPPGVSRMMPLPQVTLELVDSAIVDDRLTVGRVVSRSEFIRQAALVAADASRTRLGRELPPPPARLPYRPPRRPPAGLRTPAQPARRSHLEPAGDAD